MVSGATPTFDTLKYFQFTHELSTLIENFLFGRASVALGQVCKALESRPMGAVVLACFSSCFYLKTQKELHARTKQRMDMLHDVFREATFLNDMARKMVLRFTTHKSSKAPTKNTQQTKQPRSELSAPPCSKPKQGGKNACQASNQASQKGGGASGAQQGGGSKQASKQPSNQASKQATKQASNQASKQPSKQPSKQALPKRDRQEDDEKTSTKRLCSEDDESDDMFMLDEHATLANVLRMRFVAHVVAAVLSEPTGLLGFFHDLLLQPESVASSFVPGMPKDTLYEQMVSVHKLTGRYFRWYYCRNGHPYVVEGCGRPVKVYPCVTCGCKIGGTNHKQLRYVGDFDMGVFDRDEHVSPGDPPPGEMTMDRDVDPSLQGDTAYFKESSPQDRSTPGYALDGFVESTKESVLRKRLLLHAVLIGGMTFGGQPWRNKAKAFFGTHDMAGVQTKFEKEWQNLVSLLGSSDDDVSMLLHNSIETLIDDNKKMNNAKLSLATRSDREAWEQRFDALVADFAPTEETTRPLKAKYSNVDEQRTREMLSEQATLLPVFGFCELYHQKLLLRSVSETSDPSLELLRFFAEQGDKLDVARSLPDVLSFAKYMVSRFDRRIGSDSEITIGDALKDAPERIVSTAWPAYQAAWKIGLHLGVVIECGTTTPRNVELSTKSLVGLCLPSNTGSGLLTKALIVIASKIHNKVHKLCGVCNTKEVSTNDMASQHSVMPNFQSARSAFDAFERFVQHSCVSYSSESGKMVFEFDNMLNWLKANVFGDLPSLKVEMDDLLVRYVDDDACAAALGVVKASVQQDEMPQDVQAAIRTAVLARGVQRCLREFSQVVVVLASSIANVGKTVLLWPFVSVLLEDDFLGGARAAHVLAIDTLLRHMVDPREFGFINPAYKHINLSDATRKALQTSTQKALDLSNHMSDFAKDHLSAQALCVVRF
jgi:hypothetical protein